jgi:hypothetical protein
LVLSNLGSVRQFLTVDGTLGTSLSRPGCWAYPDMLEVGRMPGELGFDGVTNLATPAAESRSHFAAWAIVSAPLVLGMDLTLNNSAAQAALDAVWDTVTNAEVINVSQTWAGLPGAVVREWSAPNVPTLVTSPCPPFPSPTNSSGGHSFTFFPDVAIWQASTIAEGVYDLAGAQAFCAQRDDCAGFSFGSRSAEPAPGETVAFKSSIDTGSRYGGYASWAKDWAPPQTNLSQWALGGDGLLRQGDAGVCIDSAGQTPCNGCPSWMRLRACDASLATQIFHLVPAANGSSQIVSNATGQCLATNVHWIWSWTTMLSLAPCAPGDATQLFALGAADGTLRAPTADLCLGSSDRSGPASLLLKKPLTPDGRTLAALALNGALLPQTVTITLAELGLTGAYEARDLFAHAELGPVPAGGISVALAGHDSAMLLLRPAAAPTQQTNV